MSEADDGARNPRLGADLDRALGDVLGEIADPFEIAGDPNGSDQLAQVDRYRLAPRAAPRRPDRARYSKKAVNESYGL